MVSIVDSSRAKSENRRGGYDSSQLAMLTIQRQRSLTICVNSLCLECLLLSVSTASAELHEDLRTAMTAVNTVSLTVKAFMGSTKRTLVVYKFRHSQTDLPIGFEPVRQNLASKAANERACHANLGRLAKVCVCDSACSDHLAINENPIVGFLCARCDFFLGHLANGVS